jgi:hypothetical protein
MTPRYSRPLSALLVLCLTTACAPGESHAVVTVLNRATDQISLIEIDVGTAHVAARDIAPGQSVDIPYAFRSETDYQTRVVFASSKTLSARVGYVDAGLTTRDLLVVTDTEITDQTGVVSMPSLTDGAEPSHS